MRVRELDEKNAWCKEEKWEEHHGIHFDAYFYNIGFAAIRVFYHTLPPQYLHTPPMGAGASASPSAAQLPATLDEAKARELAGAEFDASAFAALQSDGGTITSAAAAQWAVDYGFGLPVVQGEAVSASADAVGAEGQGTDVDVVTVRGYVVGGQTGSAGLAPRPLVEALPAGAGAGAGMGVGVGTEAVVEETAHAEEVAVGGSSQRFLFGGQEAAEAAAGRNVNRGSSSINSNESPPLGIVGQRTSFFSPFAPKVAPKRGGGASQKTKVEVERKEAAPWNSRAKAAAPKIVKAAGPKIVKGVAGLKAVKAPNRGFTAEQQQYIDRMQFQLDPGDEW